MSGRLIVLEGTDGSGKSTQMQLLIEALDRAGTLYKKLRFPRYGNPSCAPVEQYLAGTYGSKPGDVNAYAASLFYAVDRFASYKEDWGEYYEQGGLLVADRYTTSNAVHQTSKLPEEEREDYLRWLVDLEFGKIGLPEPDLVIYLDMPTEAAAAMRRGREQATGTHADIHERDAAYLEECRKAGLQTAELLGWRVINCAREGMPRSIEEIHTEIMSLVKEMEV